MELAKGWARVGAWVTVGAGAVAMLLGASALSMLAAMAQRVTGKAMTREEMDREIERAILGRRSAEGYFTRTAADYAEIRHGATAAETQRQARARAERKASNAAKQAAREERKRMRRSVVSEGGWYDLGMAACLEQLQACAAEVRDGRRCGRDERMMRSRRERARMAELRYAIACAEDGAVPGGRVH